MYVCVYVHTNQVSRFFGVNRILGTTPRFISRMDQNPAKTMHDEYWHEHVDSKSVSVSVSVSSLVLCLSVV
jgi:hypothetical protein